MFNPAMFSKRVVLELVGDNSTRAFATTDQDHRQVVALYLWDQTHGGLSGRAASTPEEAYYDDVISRFEDENEIQNLLHEVSREGVARNIRGASKAAIEQWAGRVSAAFC